jgi:hypothetical protein
MIEASQRLRAERRARGRCRLGLATGLNHDTDFAVAG